jgi:hypothetical protein
MEAPTGKCATSMSRLRRSSQVPTSPTAVGEVRHWHFDSGEVGNGSPADCSRRFDALKRGTQGILYRRRIDVWVF